MFQNGTKRKKTGHDLAKTLCFQHVRPRKRQAKVSQDETISKFGQTPKVLRNQSFGNLAFEMQFGFSPRGMALSRLSRVPLPVALTGVFDNGTEGGTGPRPSHAWFTDAGLIA